MAGREKLETKPAIPQLSVLSQWSALFTLIGGHLVPSGDDGATALQPYCNSTQPFGSARERKRSLLTCRHGTPVEIMKTVATVSLDAKYLDKRDATKLPKPRKVKQGRLHLRGFPPDACMTQANPERFPGRQ